MIRSRTDFETGVRKVVAWSVELLETGHDHVVVGVAGGSRSGKTYFSSRLESELAAIDVGCALLYMTDYYFTKEEIGLRALQSSEEHNPVDLDFDTPAAVDLQSLRTDIEALRSGAEITRKSYVFAEGESPAGFPTAKRVSVGPFQIASRTVLVVEGLFVHHPIIATVCDYCVFLHQPDEHKRMTGRIERDVTQRGYAADVASGRWHRYVQPGFRRHIYPADFESRFDVDIFIDNPY